MIILRDYVILIIVEIFFIEKTIIWRLHVILFNKSFSFFTVGLILSFLFDMKLKLTFELFAIIFFQ